MAAGSRPSTNLNSDGTLNKTIVTTVSANGQTVTPVTTNGSGTIVTLSTSNQTKSYTGVSETVKVTGANDIINLGGAVDVATLTGNNNIVNENGNAIVTVGGAGTNKSLDINGQNNIATISSVEHLHRGQLGGDPDGQLG